MSNINFIRKILPTIITNDIYELKTFKNTLNSRIRIRKKNQNN